MPDIHQTEIEMLGAAFADPRITTAVSLAPAQFDQPSHGAIWAAIRDIHANGNHPSPSLILEHATNHGARVDSTLLPELATQGVTANADHYAAAITDAHRRRQLADTFRRGMAALDQEQPTDRIVSEVSSRLGGVTEAEEDAENLMTIDEFVDQELPPEQWVIPGLFAAGERAIVTGSEGSGKSMMLRQMALCAAAGVHPFTFRPHRPVRVLYVDAENPKSIMVRKFRDIQHALRERGTPAGDGWIQRFAQGMDLAQQRDRLALHNLCMLTRPELLVIGPAYKLYVGGSNSREEDLARQVTSVLDSLREEFGFALVLEHHSPHENQSTGKRSGRPIGSSLWRRWPEYGLGLVLTDSGRTDRGNEWRTAELTHWRGAREERPWPTELESGGRLPWTASNPEQVIGAAA